MIRRVIKEFREKHEKRKKKRNAKYTEPLNSKPNVLDAFIAYNEYGGYSIPSNCISRPAVRRLLDGRAHEPDTIEYMRTHCGEGDIVHAGTFYGDFLPGLSSAISERARIWAFEPNYDNYRCAQMTIILNDLKNVELQNIGLGEKESTKRFRIQRPSGEHMGGGSQIVKEDDPWGGTIVNIKINSLDRCVPADRTVSIIQLDVEGYEEEALKGAAATIQRCLPILILEDENNSTDNDWFRNNITSLGYLQVDDIHNNKVFIRS